MKANLSLLLMRSVRDDPGSKGDPQQDGERELRPEVEVEIPMDEPVRTLPMVRTREAE